MKPTSAFVVTMLLAAVATAADTDYRFPMAAAKWRGPAAVSAENGIRWEFAKSRLVRTQEIVHDWTPYTALAFTAHANKASNTRLYVIAKSENPQNPGPDYYILTLKLPRAGTYDFVLPFNEFGKARRPIGWRQIDYFTLHNAWNPRDKPDPEVVLTITNLRLTSASSLPATGPRMTDAQFFADLDLDRPDLAKVKAAVAAGDLTRARREIAAHIRRREKPIWRVMAKDRPTAGLPVQTARATKGKGGYYSATFKIDQPGWQRVSLPKSAFKPRGKPVGWRWITRLTLSVSSSVAAKHSNAVLYLDDVKLVGKQGERVVSDFESEATGWSGVYRSAKSAHNGTGAGKWWFLELVRTIRNDGVPRDWSAFDALDLWVYCAPPEGIEVNVRADSSMPDTAYADTILTHKFRIGGFRDHVFDFGKRIDWSSNAMTEGESSTIEWNAQLNRHFHFAHLVRAYWETGDDKYAKELADEMNAWIEDCPVLLYRSGNSPYHYAWETLNTAIRLQRTWPDAIFSCIDSPAFTDDVIVDIMKSVAEQVRHLIKNPTRANWLTAESLGIYTMGVLFPEFKDAREWRRIGIQRLYKQLDDEVYPGGMEYELALGYNNWVLREYCAVLEIAKLNGLLDEVPPDYQARIEKMFDYQMYNCMPNGRGVALNDSGNANVTRLLLQGRHLFPNRDDFVHPPSAGRLGKRPPRDSVARPYEGHYIMRSGWDRDARMLHFDAGLFGAGHQHEDKLHLALYAYGKQLLPDGGSYMYDRSRWRAYVKLTRAHNTVLVDGMDQFRRRSPNLRVWPHPWDKPSPPTDTRWRSTRGLDYCIGHYRAPYREYVDYQTRIANPKTLDTVTHTRRVLFVKPDFWIVHDTLTAKDDATHTCDALYHIEAATATVAPETNVVTSQTKNAADIVIAPLNTDGLTASIVMGKKDPPVQGWSCANRRLHPVPTAIFHKQWIRATDLMCVLYPFPADAAAPAIKTEPVDGAPGMRITLADGSKHIYLANPRPGEPIDAGGVSTDAEAVFVSGSPGASYRLLLVNGTYAETPNGRLRLAQPGAASLRGYGDGVYEIAADVAGACEVVLPDTPGQPVRVHQVDREGARLATVQATAEGPRVTLTLEADAAYEISPPGAPTLKSLMQRRRRAAAKRRAPVQFPVRKPKPLPAVAGVKVKVQAEDLAAQGGGEVEITDKKTGADGKAFLHWDNAGHWIEWRFRVPKDGAYCLSLRYCANGVDPIRTIAIDGALQAAFLSDVPFTDTGGWSNGRDDWRTQTITDPATNKPFLFHLRKGAHTLRMVNVQESMNMDYFVVHSPSEKP